MIIALLFATATTVSGAPIPPPPPPAPVVAAPAPAPRAAADVPAVITVPPGQVVKPRGDGLVSGHWTCYINAPCTLDPRPVEESVASDDPSYSASINAMLCEAKPIFCGD